MRLSSATLIGALAIVFFAILPAVVASWVAADFGVYFAYAIFAVSLGFLWGHAGLLSLGHRDADGGGQLLGRGGLGGHQQHGLERGCDAHRSSSLSSGWGP